MSLFKKSVENEVFEPKVFSDSPGEGVYFACFDDTVEKFILLAFVMCLLMFCVNYFFECFI